MSDEIEGSQTDDRGTNTRTRRTGWSALRHVRKDLVGRGPFLRRGIDSRETVDNGISDMGTGSSRVSRR